MKKLILVVMLMLMVCLVGCGTTVTQRVVYNNQSIANMQESERLLKSYEERVEPKEYELLDVLTIYNDKVYSKNETIFIIKTEEDIVKKLSWLGDVETLDVRLSLKETNYMSFKETTFKYNYKDGAIVEAKAEMVDIKLYYK